MSTKCPTGQRRYIDKEKAQIKWEPACGIVNRWGVRIPDSVLNMLGLNPNKSCKNCIKQGYLNGEIIFSVSCNPPKPQ